MIQLIKIKQNYIHIFDLSCKTNVNVFMLYVVHLIFRNSFADDGNVTLGVG